MKDGEKRSKPGTNVRGDVNTGGGDFVGRDKNTNISVNGKLLHLPSVLKEISGLAEPPGELEPKSRLPLGDSAYIIREIIASANCGNLLMRTARASDQAMQEDVGIFHLKLISDQGDVGGQLAAVKRRAQNLSLAAGLSRHLAVIRKILVSDRDMWVVSRWVSGGRSWKKEYLEGPLPGILEIRQMLSWGIDVCEALATLHRLREIHAGISAETIVVARNREVMLIQPGFAGHVSMDTIIPPHFDPQVDLQALGDLLHQSLTHQTASREPASSFNLNVSPELDLLIENIRTGAFKQAQGLKRDLILFRKKLVR
jgi:serine/threonine protein kinase